MTNTASWPIKTVALESLLPDRQNVRIQGVVTDELSTLKYLYDNEEVLDLVKDILRDGYVDLEPLMVYKEGGRYVVLEGNRRTSALKGIEEPALVAGWTSRIQAEKERVDEFESVVEVRVIVAPDRGSGLPAIARLHTRKSKKPWALEQQAKFYYDKLAKDVTVANLRALYPAESSKIPRFISMGDMAERARIASASNLDVFDFVNTPRFKMTSFEYLYKSSVFQELSGVAFSSDGFVTFTITSEDETERLLIQILLDLRSKLLSTRSAKIGSLEHREYVQSLMDIARGKKGLHSEVLDGDHLESEAEDKGEDRAEGLGSAIDTDSAADAESSARSDGDSQESNDGSQSVGIVEGEAVTGERGSGEDLLARTKREPAPKATAYDNRLNFNGITLSLRSSGLRVRYDELQRIDLQVFPNAAIDMMRTFLECSLKVYFEEGGDPVPSPNGPVQLSHCLSHALSRLGHRADVSHVISILKSKQTETNGRYLGSARALNNSNHEPSAIFSREDVNTVWAQLRPLVEFLLRGQPASTVDDAAEVVRHDK